VHLCCLEIGIVVSCSLYKLVHTSWVKKSLTWNWFCRNVMNWRWTSSMTQETSLNDCHSKAFISSFSRCYRLHFVNHFYRLKWNEVKWKGAVTHCNWLVHQIRLYNRHNRYRSYLILQHSGHFHTGIGLSGMLLHSHNEKHCHKSDIVVPVNWFDLTALTIKTFFKQQFIHNVNGDWSKTAIIIKRWYMISRFSIF